MSMTWVVVADTSRARIFNVEKPARTLNEIQTVTHPEARLHEGDLISDKTEKPDVRRQVEADRFAAHVCSVLEAKRKNGECQRLYLVAAPSFLGMIRKHQSAALKQLVVAEVDKNLAMQDATEILQHLPKLL
ncbi:host attachment protein [Candidatus Endoriftia persephonae]|jgi:protein required for attachment to host cells|uniref:Host attachment protein n=2 Tax=Gammaproteobacteria TaxID=1236 RepID=G2FDK5_9GAMM|nr:host attachment protein [Candidatus Endoriftia persephone]EGW55060.1 host attachment protein [endosymbiont of Tevnia jerichonana (vent Tica)]USF88326.1 host attachment protein [Candidatus Endoriftia persephone]